MNSFRKIFFHIFVLAGLGLSPLYGVLSKEPNFFLAHNSDPNDFIVLIGVVSFVFPLVIASGVTLFLCFFSSYKVLVVRFFVAFLAALVLLPFVKKLTGESISGSFIVVGFLGVVFSVFYGKLLAPKLFLNYISPALIMFPVLFFFEPKIFVLAVPEYSETDYPTISIPSEIPVVFILFDEFPLSSLLNENLGIDQQAFPNFHRLASKAHWFRNASSSYAFTGHSIRSIFTGKRQDNSRFGTYKYFPNNLFTLLGHDYKVEAHESALRLCPPNICLDDQESERTRDVETFWKDLGGIYLNLILPQPKSFYIPDVSQSFKDFWGQNNEKAGISAKQKLFVRSEFLVPITEPDFEQKQIGGRGGIFQVFLSKLSSMPKKKFYFLHILFPHQPYRFLSSGKKYDLNGKLDYIGLIGESPKGGTWGNEKWLINIQNQKLLNQVGYTDYLLGQLLDKLEANNLLNPALFILAADHGVSVKEGGFRREVRDESLSNIASVPLFIKLPGQEEGAVSDLPATLLDILPTLADVLDVEVPWEMTGHSLLNFPPGKRGRIIHGYQFQAYPVPEDLKPGLRVEVKRKHDLFGKFEGWDKFRLLDKNSKTFMDEPVSKFKVQAMESVQVKLDLGSRVKAKPDFLPAIVQGQITGIKNSAGWSTLIAVNGVFRAVSPIVKIKNQEKILAFLPEIAFKEGDNDVAVYLTRKPFVNGGEIFKPLLN
jgi:hypothetical protein